MINIEQLQLDLQTKIAALDSASSSAEDLLVATAALDGLTQDRINAVDTVDDLPVFNVLNELSGNIYYVRSLNTLVVAGANDWLGIDNRRLRRDVPTSVAAAWGCNSVGRLGDGTQVMRSSPVTVVGGITNWSRVASGGAHGLGVTDTGIAYSWGFGTSGELGTGEPAFNLYRSSPVTVTGGITNWSQVAAGVAHSLGLTDTGILYVWGNNLQGQLGEGTRANYSSPVSTTGNITNWSQVAAGRDHTVGVTDTGIAYAWGRNDFGQVGDDTVIYRSSPITVAGGITNWSQVASGSQHCLGVTDTGIVYGWGNNSKGKLGDYTSVNQSSPVTVVGGITNWSLVEGGNNHSLGLTDTGILYAWGYDGQGSLGIDVGDYTIDYSSPVTVVGGITNWSQISAAGNQSFGITDTGILYAWGSGFQGRLGTNSNFNRSSPVTVVGGITSWSQISAGYGTFTLGIYID